MSESSRIETLLGALVDGENVDVVPQSRIETYLLALLKGDTNVKEPQSRIEAYLYQLCKNGMSGGGITPTGTLEITENGTHDVTNYASAEVNVASSGGGDLDALLNKTITEVNSDATNIIDKLFYNCKELKTVNLPNVKSVNQQGFQSCSKLETVNMPNVTDIKSNAFRDCTKLKEVNFPLLTKIENYYAFSSSGLQSIFLPNATYIGKNSFQDCNSLMSANFPLITTATYSIFQSCYNLVDVKLPLVEKVEDSAFYVCCSLQILDLPKVNNIYSNAFSECYSLKTLVLRSESICTLTNANVFDRCYHILGTTNSTYNPNGDKDGYFYVPRALLSDDDATKDYRRATNWTTYASQFRALEDYTVDGTITGELDETKI